MDKIKWDVPGGIIIAFAVVGLIRASLATLGKKEAGVTWHVLAAVLFVTGCVAGLVLAFQ